MSVIVRTTVKLIIGITALFGAYLVLNSDITAGGGFAGGIIFAALLVLMTLSFGRDMVIGKFSGKIAQVLLSLSALTFVLVGLLGYMEGYFLSDFLSKLMHYRLFKTGTLAINDISISILVFSAVYLGIIALLHVRIEGKDE